MRTNILLLLVFVALSYSCSIKKEFGNKSMVGKFYGIADGFIEHTNNQYFLDLKEENLFTLKIIGHDYRPQCEGRWEYKEENLILKCSDIESLAKKLSNSYMNQREFRITVRNKDKLEFNNVILKRK